MHTHNFYVCDPSATSISWYVCLWENYTAHESMIKLRYFLGLGPVKINIPEARTNKCIQILGRTNEEIHIVHISKYICQTTICISPHDSKVDFLPNDCRLVQSINTLTFFYKYLCGHSKKKYRLLNDTWTGNEPIKVSDLESSHCFIRRILLYL